MVDQQNKLQSAWLQYLLTAFGVLFASFFLLLILVVAGVFGPVPGNKELREIEQQQPSRILTSDGAEIGTYPVQAGTRLSLDNISPDLIDALLAIEDIRYYRHNGIDYRALGRVLIRSILLRQNAGGGSTLTQQLAKNLYPRSNRGGFFIITDKLREMLIALRLESAYSKDEILALYLNNISFGEDTFGIDMASHRFFNIPPSELSLAESATLAGQLRATTFYNPHRNPGQSEQRRNLVIRQMERYDMISSETAASVLEQPLETNYNRTANRNETALYFRYYLRDQTRDILQNIPALDGEQYNLEADELTIYTTLDSRIQQAAEEAVSLHLKQLQAIFDNELIEEPVFSEKEDPDVLLAWRLSGYYRELVSEGYTDEEIEEILHTPVGSHLFTWNDYEKRNISPYDEIRYYLSFLNAGFLAMHPESGYILAWVGGADYRHFPYDQVLARRQSGSAFKPILYAAALESGRSPCEYQRNRLTTYASYDDWTPRNYQDEYGGRYSLQASLAKSVNTAAVNLAMETGMPAIQKTAALMGINSSFPDAPSIALGTAETTLLELTTAYTSFLNNGKPVTPSLIKKIVNSSGEVIYDFTTDQSPNNIPDFPYTLQMEYSHQYIDSRSEYDEPGISPETAATMVTMLEKAVNEGTGKPLRSRFGITHAVAGKTGTTQQYADGWFIGLTPGLVFGVRVGGWNRRVHFREFPAFGSQTALPIAGHFLNILHHDTANPLATLPDQFPSDLTNSPHDMSCADYRDDRVRDRLRDFFSGRSSDDPVVVGGEEEKQDDGNIFRRLGRKLGITDN